MRNAVIVGAGLGGLATALRLTQNGFNVTLVEKHHQRVDDLISLS